MIHITEDKLKAAIQICLGGDSIYTEQREAKLVHNIKALSIADVSGMLTKEQILEKHYKNYQKRISYEDKVLSAMEEYAQQQVKNCIKPAAINSGAAPEWLTTERRAEAKMKYESHVFGDRNRVKAVEMIQMWAGLDGYTIGLKKASELLQQHCL